MTILFFFLLALWIFGGIIATIIMFIRSVIHPFWDEYTQREFLIGFIGSWYTVAILANIIKDDL